MHATLLILANVYAMNIVEAQHADLAFGHAQVAQLMQDRPEMAPVILKEDALRKFLVRNFAGLDTGNRVAWENRETECGSQSEYCPMGGSTAGRVRITNSTDFSAEEKCTMAVFELENARARGQFKALDRMAWDGQYNREDFARQIVYLEFLTGLRTRAFFRLHPLPQQSKNRILATCMEDPSDLSKYMDFMEVHPEMCNNEYYRKRYDDILRGKGGPVVPADALKKEEDAYNRLFAAPKSPDAKQEGEDYLSQLIGPSKDRPAAVDELLKIINEKTIDDK